LLTLVVIPAIFGLVKGYALPRSEASAVPAGGQQDVHEAA
jgi:hypothetical protein